MMYMKDLEKWIEEIRMANNEALTQERVLKLQNEIELKKIELQYLDKCKCKCGKTRGIEVM